MNVVYTVACQSIQGECLQRTTFMKRRYVAWFCPTDTNACEDSENEAIKPAGRCLNSLLV